KYAEEGAYNLKIHLTHEAAPAADTTGTASVAESVPVVTAQLVNGPGTNDPHNVQLAVTYTDTGVEAHTLLINWGDGTFDTISLPPQAGGTFTQGHVYKNPGDNKGPTQVPIVGQIVVTVVDDEGTSSAPAVVAFPPGLRGWALYVGTFRLDGPSDGV